MTQRPKRNLRLLLGSLGRARRCDPRCRPASCHPAGRRHRDQHQLAVLVERVEGQHGKAWLAPQGEGSVKVELDLLGLGGTELRTYKFRSIE